jgi:hypothetical protein
MNLSIRGLGLFTAFFLATLSSVDGYAGTCHAYLSSLKYRSPFGLKAHAPKKFSENAEDAADLMRAARSFRRFVGSDLDAPSLELAPVAEQLLKLISNAKPFSFVPNDRTSMFDSFITEASLKIQFKKVSLVWLTNFSYRLSYLLTNDPIGYTYDRFRTHVAKSGSWKSPKSWRQASEIENPADKILTRFIDSDILTLPVSIELGIYEINRLLIYGIHPIQQIKRNVSIEGFENYPDEVWDRDFSRIGYVLTNREFRDFGTKVLDSAVNLSAKQRAQVEFIFYYLSYEQPWKLFGPGVTREELRLRVLGDFTRSDTSSLYYLATSADGFSPLLNRAGIDTSNPAELKKWLSESVDLLAKIVESIH